MKYFKYISAFLIAVLLGTNYISCTRNDRATETLAMIEALQDTLRVVYDDLGRASASIASLSASSSKSFLNLSSKDSLILELQDLVRNTKRVKAGIVHTVETSVRDTGSTIIIRDTVLAQGVRWPVGGVKDDDYFSGMVRVWPEYSVWKVSFKDTILYNIKEIKRGFLNLGQSRYEVTATNKNPYSTTTGLKSFLLTTRKKRYNIGLQAGYGVLFNDKGAQLGWTIGVGINYSLLSF